YLPDLDGIGEDSWQEAKAIFLNYPNNPTAAMADKAFYERLVAKAKEHNVIVVHDAAYTEMYYNPDNKPLSILEIPGAKDVAIEFHSLSKTYNMTGWRIAMAVGNETLVGGLGRIKENMDSGAFQAVQEVGIAALTQGEPEADRLRALYKERRDVVLEALGKAAIESEVPEATFYIWSKTPKEFASSADFVTKLLQETGVVVTPGNGFGAPGEGYFRISLTVPSERLKEAVSRIASL
ncbi:MAG: aminotransferase class I/II-fold pyridoxal phosphate-dependent enzyme, partial [Desulfovibrio sp.]